MIGFLVLTWICGREARHRGLPEFVFEVAPEDYANIYRRLGQTQAALGQTAEALASFERYLMLAGDGADPVIAAVMAEVNA